jgi:hypothetical protein
VAVSTGNGKTAEECSLQINYAEGLYDPGFIDPYEFIKTTGLLFIPGS